MKRIILTGGGTAGHVTPNIALLPRLKELQYDIHYIGSYNGIEKELIEQFGIKSWILMLFFPRVVLSPFLLFLPEKAAKYQRLFTSLI